MNPLKWWEQNLVYWLAYFHIFWCVIKDFVVKIGYVMLHFVVNKSHVDIVSVENMAPR